MSSYPQRRIIFLGMALWSLPAFAAPDILPVDGDVAVKALTPAFVHAEAYQTPDARVRLGIYNIQDFFDGADDSRRTWDHVERQAQAAALIMNQVNADIWLLQEIESAAVLEVLNRHQAQPYAVGYVTSFGSGVGRHNKLNVAVLSRFPLDAVTEIDFSTLSGRGRPTRGILRFECALDDALTLLLYNVHLKANWGNQQRNISQRHHALRILREDSATRLKGRQQIEMVVAGDFNVDPEHPSFAGDPSLHALSDLVYLWAGRPLEERITVPTRYGVKELEFPPVAFDHFYVTPSLVRGDWTIGQSQVLPLGVHSEDVRVIAGEDETTVSDHYPVYVDLHRSQR